MLCNVYIASIYIQIAPAGFPIGAIQRELLIIHDQHRNAGIIVDIVNDALNSFPVTASNAASNAGRDTHDVIIIEYGIDPQQVERLPQIVVGGQIKRPINWGRGTA